MMAHREIITLLSLCCVCLLICTATLGARSEQIVGSKKLTNEELSAMFKEAREQPKPIHANAIPTDFDEKEGEAARARLAAEKRKIEELEQKAAVAMDKWKSLTPEQQAQILKLARERAEKRENEIKRDIRLSEQLLMKEAVDLEAKLDEQLKREREEEEQKEREQIDQENQEFMRRKEAHRAKQYQERTTVKSALFWLGTLALSAIISRFALHL